MSSLFNAATAIRKRCMKNMNGEPVMPIEEEYFKIEAP
jgi:hypothetical protein